MNSRGWIGSSVLLATVIAGGVGLAARKYASIQKTKQIHQLNQKEDSIWHTT